MNNDAALKLAQAILRYDEDFPGEAESSVEAPFDVWAEWIDLAGQVEKDAD